MVTEHRLSRVKACKLAGVSRAALYRERADWAKRDTPVVQALNEVVEHHGRWGFWKCFHRLRDQGHVWNHKKVHRVYCSMKLNLPRRAKKRVFTRERMPLLVPTAINQMWALDFMHDTLYDGRKFRLLNVIDEANREALRMECGSSFPARRLVRVMDELIDFYGKPRAIRMDNGPEMTSDLFVTWAKELGIELRYIQPGKPNQNAYVERFNKSVRTEVLNAWLFNSLEHAQEVIEDWREDYNGIRGHESLGNRPPAAYLPRFVKTENSIYDLSKIWGSLRRQFRCPVYVGTDV